MKKLIIVTVLAASTFAGCSINDSQSEETVKTYYSVIKEHWEYNKFKEDCKKILANDTEYKEMVEKIRKEREDAGSPDHHIEFAIDCATDNYINNKYPDWKKKEQDYKIFRNNCNESEKELIDRYFKDKFAKEEYEEYRDTKRKYLQKYLHASCAPDVTVKLLSSKKNQQATVSIVSAECLGTTLYWLTVEKKGEKPKIAACYRNKVKAQEKVDGMLLDIMD